MFILMHPLQKNPEPRIRHPPFNRRIRKVRMDNDHRNQTKYYPEPECIEASEGIERPNDPVVIGVEKRAVLLENRLVRVILCVVVCRGAVGMGSRRGDVSASRTC